MAQAVFQRSFSGGEIAPVLAARADQARYLAGLRTCRNFIVRREGGVSNRPGLRFVGESRDNTTATFLLRYVSEIAGASLLLEAGEFYLRVYDVGGLVRLTGVVAWDGATLYQIGDLVRSGGVNYYCVKSHTNHVPPNGTYWYAMPTDILEIPTPFGNAGFNWEQSGNIITLTSTLVAPHELIFFGLTQWRLQPVSTAPAIDPPTALVLSLPVANPGTLSYNYVVTAGAQQTLEESTPSAITQITTIATPTPDKPVHLAWTAPAQPADEYYIYKDPYGNGTYGFVGVATGQVEFLDTGILPDFTVTPPKPRVLFAAAGDYPSKSANFQQRRFFAGSDNNPDAVFGSRVGFRSNFNISSPLQDDDAITFRIAANQHNPVRNMLGLNALVILTDAGEWSIGGNGQPPLAPQSIDAQQQCFVGANDVPPVVIGTSVLYVQARGALVREIQFPQSVYVQLIARDLTIFASHLFDGFTINRLDYAQTPHSTAWVVRSDGTLLGLTYILDQDILAWHRHDTGAGGQFEDVCVVPEPGEDAVYVLVRRTIGGVFKRYIEKLERRTIVDFTLDSFFVDAGLTYNGAPATTIAGLDHLEGEIVAVVADGKVIFNGDPTAANAPDFAVIGGTIAAVLPASSVIHAGLPIRFAELETLDLDVSGSDVRAKKKRVGSVQLLLDQSVRTFQVGPDNGHLRAITLKPFEGGTAGLPFTGEEEINITAAYNDFGRVFLRHTDPLPLTVLGILPIVELGG